MGYTTWLAVLIMGFAVIGMAAAETTQMSGGTEVDISGTGASEGHAYEFTYSDTTIDSGYVEVNILANATVKGVSSARIKTSVPTLQSMSKTYGNDTLKVSAQGTVDVTAEGHSDLAAVNSRAQIFAKAANSSGYEEGYAYIASQIYGVDNQPTKGRFYADSSANGKATYSITNTTGRNRISGSVEGKTTLEAESTSDHAELMGLNSAMLPGDQIGENIEAFYTEVLPTKPLLAAIASGATTNLNIIDGEGVAAGVANIIQLSAINDGLPADALSYAAGTVEDISATASGVNITADGNERKVSATKSAKMSADVRVLKALDSAAATSLLATGAISTQDEVPQTARAGAVARTYAAVNRENPGSMTDGSDRAWGEAFISSGSWNAWGATLEDNNLIEKATVSGKLVQDWNQVGMGSGAFLQYKKNELAFADVGITQFSSSELEDLQEIDAEIMGPKAHSLGSSGWDGSGVSANMKDLHVDAKNEPSEDFVPETISTDIADVDAYLWCDGTNDLQYNGLFMGASDPVFDPTGNGQFSGVVAVYSPSPTQRLTGIGILTMQPSPF